MRYCASVRREQRGVALIESLVSMVVLAIGLLGMAALLTYSMKSMGKAQYAAQATYAAQMITSAVFAQEGNNLAGLNALNGDRTAAPPTGTAASAINQALSEWSAYTQANLPAGLGVLTVTAPDSVSPCLALPCQVNVVMTWSGADHVPQSYQTSIVAGY